MEVVLDNQSEGGWEEEVRNEMGKLYSGVLSFFLGAIGHHKRILKKRENYWIHSRIITLVQCGRWRERESKVTVLELAEPTPSSER